MNEYIQITNVFNFLLMREAHELGLVDDETWKQFVMELLPKCILCDSNEDESQTCENCKHNGEKHAYDYACDKCTDMDKFQIDTR